MRTRLVATLAALALVAGCGGGAERETRLIVIARAPATNAFSDLYMLQVDGSLRRLTHGGIDNDPAWSPDGQRIAFLRAHRNVDPTLIVANADGSGQRPLPLQSSEGPVFSPDSRRILFVRGGRIYVTSDDWSSGIELVNAAPSTAGNPQWSPDGDAISFVLGPDSRSADVYVMNADGSGRRRVTHVGAGAGRPYSPLWSPDGTQIAYLLPGSLEVIGADGTGHRVLTRFPGPDFPSSLAWSPDGKRIAFARLRLDGVRSHSGLYVVRADGTDLHRLTRDIDSTPSWSPDGKVIVFQRLVGFHVSEITAMNPDGGDQRSLTSGGWSDSSPSWQPGP
jgi:TolB protein